MKRIHRRLAAALAVLVLVGGGWAWSRTQRPLIDRAVDIGAAPPWHFDAVSAYAVQGVHDGAIVGIRGLELVSYDPRTGTVSALPGLKKRMARRTECIALSPDGRWVLWVVRGEVHATALDGASDRVWHTGALRISQVGWQADSQGWFAVAGTPGRTTGQLLVCSPAAPRALRSISLSSVGSMYTLAGALRDGRILLGSALSRARGPADLLAVDPSAPSASAVLPYAYRPPEAVRPGQTVVTVASPRGDRLLWGVRTQGIRFGPVDWLRRLLHLPPASDRGLMRLYGTGADGSRPSLIMEASMDEEGLAGYGWAADGRHLLISRHGRVLSVPTQ